MFTRNRALPGALAIPILIGLAGPAQAQSPSDSTAAPTFETATNVAGCNKALMGAFGPIGKLSGADQKAAIDKLYAQLGACAVRVEGTAKTRSDLSQLASIYGQTKMTDKMIATYERVIAATRSKAEKGDVMNSIVSGVLPYDGDISADQFAQAERWADRADALGPNAHDAQILIHATLADAYPDANAQMMTHAEKALKLARAIPAADRAKAAEKRPFLEAHAAMASALARKWDFEKAAATLREGLAQYPGDTTNEFYEKQAIRLGMVGKPAPEIPVEHWLQGTGSTGRLDFSQSKVTVIQFTNPV